MERTRGVALATYLVGGTLTLLPLLDASLALAPFQLADVRWRFGAAGLAANSLMIPSAGLLLLLVTAIAHGHNLFRRILGVVSLLLAVVCLSAMVLFILDAVQTRPDVRPELGTSFLAATGSAIAKMLIAAATLWAIGVVSLRGMRPKEKMAPTPPLVGMSQMSRS